MEYFSNLKAKLIYVFRIPDAAHSDCLKIGEATFDDGNITLPPNSSALNKAAKARIDQYTKTAGITYELLYTEIAIFVRDGRIAAVNDKEVHDVLLRRAHPHILYLILRKPHTKGVRDRPRFLDVLAALNGPHQLHHHHLRTLVFQALLHIIIGVP